MNHPDLEKQLHELKMQRQEATKTLRDLASEAVDSTDKINKTMTMFLKLSGEDGCECKGTYCACDQSKKTSRFRLRKKLKNINGVDS